MFIDPSKFILQELYVNNSVNCSKRTFPMSYNNLGYIKLLIAIFTKRSLSVSRELVASSINNIPGFR